ncbi:hypothetical protein QN386_20230 [Pseudomonas sp. CCI3.2]|uniref:hypothetical protein n=1 Tax=unclassified Pseudomonas TaxID=196821 RepID=UPI002AC91EA9|nr:MULTISPECIES: hypothetical protein [unclassified Pseudomonas]MEB0080005.1 hypothetical protein [Pseudomonas sp. MH10out]MEB0093844.1 hypothetical protein [Pseudomonas sp. CCI4.2]MEB0103636.1 hypothetical protein [Pseudomonas sp. CCI3.2]MEB0132928.1 hypothetical protein [Pseudomonas sp. CCI2.4]MEB0160064.1 hypothetical protein [Pseudomonas sp. AH2 (2023)]
MNKVPLPRGTCLDCTANFPVFKAICRFADTIFPDGELDILVCPECGSYSVEEVSHEQTQ